MAAKLTRLTHKIGIQLHVVAELCHLQFSLQAASPETFGYTVVLMYVFTFIFILNAKTCDKYFPPDP
jgi:hypothetical protein